MIPALSCRARQSPRPPREAQDPPMTSTPEEYVSPPRIAFDDPLHVDNLNRTQFFKPSVLDPDRPFADQLIRPSGMHFPMIPPIRVPSGKYYPVKFKRTMAY